VPAWRSVFLVFLFDLVWTFTKNADS
jgi:hypothetical protein